MKKIEINTTVKKVLADVFTPVSLYLRLRDRFRDTILLESTDSHAADNSYSFICINAIAGVEISSKHKLELKYPNANPKRMDIENTQQVPQIVWNFMQSFSIVNTGIKEARFAQGFFGYTSYDAVQFFEAISFDKASHTPSTFAIPLMRYRLYQYVIGFNHFKDEMYICENHFSGIKSEMHILESIINNRDIPVFPFKTNGVEVSNMTDDEYINMVQKGIASCHRGDVFQIVLSRRFEQSFIGDEFNVYRSLRNINPSPYLFYFDYGDYKIFGSSPESQLIIRDGKAIVHPIAGTFKRSGEDDQDRLSTQQLLQDPKENAEHVMLVDLARNDLSRVCDDVDVTHYKQIQYFSHVIHMVSEVCGHTRTGYNPFDLIAKTFPAGTLSGAPKYKAMTLINEYEPTPRHQYGGAIGFVGLDGSCNHAIMIRTFLSKSNTLTYQAGAGVVNISVPQSELQEVNNKLNALKNAIIQAQEIQ